MVPNDSKKRSFIRAADSHGSALNSNRKASFDRIFGWHNHFIIFAKKSKMILFQNKNQKQAKLNGSNTFYSSNLEQNNAILFQITRQGQFKPFLLWNLLFKYQRPSSAHTQKGYRTKRAWGQSLLAK
jgi:hypothetical protein